MRLVMNLEILQMIGIFLNVRGRMPIGAIRFSVQQIRIVSNKSKDTSWKPLEENHIVH